MAEQNNDKLLSKDELRKLEDRGYTPRGEGFAKDNKFVSEKEIDSVVSEIRAEEADRQARDQLIESTIAKLSGKVSMITRILARNAARVKGNESKDNEGEADTSAFKAGISALQGIKDSVSSINGSLVRINKAIENNKKRNVGEEYKKEEAKLENQPKGKAPAKTPVKEEGPSFGSLLKDFFTNPAVIAAFSGIVYMFLPKDVKEKIGAFFKGFSEGGDRTLSELSTLEKAILAAGTALATFLGAKFIQSIADGVSTLVQLIAKAKTTFGSLKKGGAKKAAAAIAKKAATSPGIVAGAVGVGAFAAMSSQEGEKPTAESKPSTAAGGAPSGTAPEQTSAGVAAPAGDTGAAGGLKPGGGEGLKPGGGTGLKAEPPPPVMTGDDKPVMDMIKKHEGVRTKPYKDSLGLWTVGVGHLIGNGKELPPNMNREFSMSEVDAMFAEDFKHHKDAAQKIPGFEKANSTGKAALIDLTFNMGPAWYKKWPNFTKALAAGDAEGAAKSLETSIWYKQVGARARTIVNMIKNGIGSEVGKGIASAPSATPESTSGDKGTQLSKSSEGVEAASSSKEPKVITSSVDNSSLKKQKEGTPPPPSIPSPVASRDSLNTNNKHSTSYA